jgi:hypothetical protein
VEWPGLDDLPILSASCFAGSIVAPGEIYLAIGQFAPPIFPGTREEQAERLQGLDVLTARPLVRLMLSPQRAKELIQLLQAALANHQMAVDAEVADNAT